jgi:hypothetical protein
MPVSSPYSLCDLRLYVVLAGLKRKIAIPLQVRYKTLSRNRTALSSQKFFAFNAKTAIDTVIVVITARLRRCSQ